MDLSHLTPEQVAQLRAILIPESPAPQATSSSTDAAAPSPFSSSLPPPTQVHFSSSLPTPTQAHFSSSLPTPSPAQAHFSSSLPTPAQAHFSSSLPPPTQAPTAVAQRQSVRFPDPGSRAQTAAATIPPPITQLYQSRQHSASGHPSSGHPSTPSSFQPFLGISSLGVGFAAGHANQARLASAATTLPRQPTLSRRTSRSASTRTRGPAIQPPAIPVELAPGSALHLRSCFVSGTPEPVVRLTVKIYPPAVCFLLYICLMQKLT
jgi:hypothetical protein